MIEAISADPAILTTEGVLKRRLIAWLIDVVLVTVLVAVLYAVLAIVGLVTFGLGWALFAVVPVVPFAYAFGFLASGSAATPGQSLMGLYVVEHTTGRRPTALEALVSTAVFLVLLTTIAPVLLLALVAPRHRAPQDILSGLLMVHRDPLTTRRGVWNMSQRPTA